MLRRTLLCTSLRLHIREPALRLIWNWTGFINGCAADNSVPQGLKPTFLAALDGTAKAVPFPDLDQAGTYLCSPISFSASLTKQVMGLSLEMTEVTPAVRAFCWRVTLG
jgi:hypothetical protein